MARRARLLAGLITAALALGLICATASAQPHVWPVAKGLRLAELADIQLDLHNPKDPAIVGIIRPNQLVRFSLASNEFKSVTAPGQFRMVSWGLLPDGRIVVHRESGPDGGIWIYGRDGTTTERVCDSIETVDVGGENAPRLVTALTVGAKGDIFLLTNVAPFQRMVPGGHTVIYKLTERMPSGKPSYWERTPMPIASSTPEGNADLTTMSMNQKHFVPSKGDGFLFASGPDAAVINRAQPLPNGTLKIQRVVELQTREENYAASEIDRYTPLSFAEAFDGSLLVVARVISGPRRSQLNDRQVVLRVSPDGKTINTIAGLGTKQFEDKCEFDLPALSDLRFSDRILEPQARIQIAAAPGGAFFMLKQLSQMPELVFVDHDADGKLAGEIVGAFEGIKELDDQPVRVLRSKIDQMRESALNSSPRLPLSTNYTHSEYLRRTEAAGKKPRVPVDAGEFLREQVESDRVHAQAGRPLQSHFSLLPKELADELVKLTKHHSFHTDWWRAAFPATLARNVLFGKLRELGANKSAELHMGMRMATNNYAIAQDYRRILERNDPATSRLDSEKAMEHHLALAKEGKAIVDACQPQLQLLTRVLSDILSDQPNTTPPTSTTATQLPPLSPASQNNNRQPGDRGSLTRAQILPQPEPPTPTNRRGVKNRKRNDKNPDGTKRYAQGPNE